MNNENLKSWKPGQSGNPSGKPVGIKDSKTILRELLSRDIEIEDIDGVPKRMSGLNAIYVKQYVKAVKEGDKDAANLILERLEGKVPNRNFVSGDPENPHGVTINVNRPATPPAIGGDDQCPPQTDLTLTPLQDKISVLNI